MIAVLHLIGAFVANLIVEAFPSLLMAGLVVKVPKCVRLFFRQKTKQAAIADWYSLKPVTKATSEFIAR
jgi:hypothetical protein